MSSIENTVQTFLSAVSNVYNTRDVSVINSILTSDCAIQLVPAAFLKRSSLPPNFSLTPQQWMGHMAKQFPAISSSTAETFDTVIDKPNKKAGMHMRLDVVLVDERTISLEYAIFLHLREENGEAKINKVVEFVDGEAAGPFQGIVEGLLAKLQEEKEKGGK